MYDVRRTNGVPTSSSCFLLKPDNERKQKKHVNYNNTNTGERSCSAVLAAVATAAALVLVSSCYLQPSSTTHCCAFEFLCVSSMFRSTTLTLNKKEVLT